MRLGEKQRLFTRLMLSGAVLLKLDELGLEATFGDAYRDPRAFGALGQSKDGVYGAKYSCHKSRLALDLNLFRGGVYLDRTDDHQALGAWWEQQHELNCWGGRFNDGNHYSMTHDGMK